MYAYGYHLIDKQGGIDLLPEIAIQPELKGPVKQISPEFDPNKYFRNKRYGLTE